MHYEGVECRKCGSTLRYTSNDRCVSCHRAKVKRHRDKYPLRHRMRNAQWVAENAQKRAEYTRRYRELNREQLRAKALERRNKDPEAARASYTRWAKANPEKHAARAARYKTQRLGATPAWSDKSACDRFYALAAELEAAFGVEMHVDHVIPLRGRLVCGLHVPENLQVVTGEYNVRKRNRFSLHE